MTMLPGKYYVGDPCYALGEERYAQFLECIGCNDAAQKLLQGGVLEGEFSLPDGPRLAVFSTLWGDGRYEGNDGREYMVDAGCIAALPWDIVDPKKLESNGLEEWEPTEFEGTWQAHSDCSRALNDGLLHFGHVTINTGDSPDEDEGEDY